MTERASRRATNPPTGTVTFLFTDIEGSTAMWEKDPRRMQGTLARHDEILRSSIESNGGYVFKTVGDAFCAAFATGRQALEATLAAQRALFAEAWDGDAVVRVRMALHTGATDERDGDYFGPPVNRVARLLGAGHGGQVLLSAVTYGLVRDELEPGADLEDLGEHRLKDLRHSERIYQLVVPDLPKEFPVLKTLDTRSDERYGLVRLLGSGETAEVYLAHDKELDRDVAFKVLKNQYARNERFVERFKHEGQNAALLSHPNIVQVYDRGETNDGACYVVMEHVPGGTLEERISREGALPPDEAIALALQVARALSYAHERGAVHRDLKPQNILLTGSGEAKVADFGIARATASGAMMEESAILAHFAHYISPEQALGRPAGPQSDLYSLGVVLYKMLTGEVPHDAESPIAVAMRHVNGLLRPPKEANPDVPTGASAVTVRLLARDPADRYRRATELIEDLERVREGELPAAAAAADAVTGQVDQATLQPPSPTREAGGAPPVPPPLPEGGSGDGGGRRPSRTVVLVAGLFGVFATLLGLVAFVLVPYLGGDAESTAAVPPEQSSTPGYVLVQDNTGRLSVEVPDEWSDVDGTTWDFRGGKIGQSIIATTDLEAWYHHNYYHDSSEGIDDRASEVPPTPGMLFGLSRSLVNQYPEDTEDQVLSLPEYDYTGTCEYDERDDYDDGTYAGRSDHWIDCGETNAEVYIHALLPEDRSHVVVIQVTAVSEADLEAQKHVLDTFKVARS